MSLILFCDVTIEVVQSKKRVVKDNIYLVILVLPKDSILFTYRLLLLKSFLI